jgi:hypothetical protein
MECLWPEHIASEFLIQARPSEMAARTTSMVSRPSMWGWVAEGRFRVNYSWALFARSVGRLENRRSCEDSGWVPLNTAKRELFIAIRG